MKSPAAYVLVVALGLGGLAAVGTPDSDSSAARKKAKKRPAAIVVDPQSRGGRCNDRLPPLQKVPAATPWCSLVRAVLLARTGSEVILRGGTYESIALIPRPGSRLTLRGYPRERPRFGSLTIPATDGLTVDRALIRTVDIGPGVRNFSLTGSRISAGISLRAGAAGIAIAGNDIANPTGGGVFFSTARRGADLVSSRITIRGNRFHDLGVSAVNVRGFRDVLIEGNEMTGVHPWKAGQHTNVIYAYNGGSGLTVRNNVLHDNYGIGVFAKGGTISRVSVKL